MSHLFCNNNGIAITIYSSRTGTINDNMPFGTAKTQSGRESNYSRQCGAIPLSNPKQIKPHVVK